MPTVSLDVTRSGWGGDINKIEKAIVSLQEYLFWILQVLDSGNVKYLNTDRTVIRSDDRTTLIDGSQFKMLDIDKNQRLVMGYNSETEKYEFTLFNKNGDKTITIDENGNAVFSGKIVGGSIESNTTIEVTTYLSVGNNIYVGKENEETGTVKKIQFFEGESDFNRAVIKATRKSDGGADLRIIAPRIEFSSLETNAFVTVDGIKHYLEFD